MEKPHGAECARAPKETRTQASLSQVRCYTVDRPPHPRVRVSDATIPASIRSPRGERRTAKLAKLRFETRVLRRLTHVESLPGDRLSNLPKRDRLGCRKSKFFRV